MEMGGRSQELLGQIIEALLGRSRWLCVGLLVVMGTYMVVIAPDDVPVPVLADHQLPVVVIDAGHGGKDEGAKSKGVLEKQLALDLALRLDSTLKTRGFPTVLTRKDDRFLTLPMRAAIANEIADPAIFISLHFNQGRGKGTSGIETFYASIKHPEGRANLRGWRWVGFFLNDDVLDSGENLAADVQSGLIAKTGARNRGIRPRSLHVTRQTRIPAILVEGGFLTDTMECALLQNGDYMQRLADGIADGVETWSASQPRRRATLADLVKEAGRKVSALLNE